MIQELQALYSTGFNNELFIIVSQEFDHFNEFIILSSLWFITSG